MCGSGYPTYPKILTLTLNFFLQILKFTENMIRKILIKLFIWKKKKINKTKGLCILKDFFL